MNELNNSTKLANLNKAKKIEKSKKEQESLREKMNKFKKIENNFIKPIDGDNLLQVLHTKYANINIRRVTRDLGMECSVLNNEISKLDIFNLVMDSELKSILIMCINKSLEVKMNGSNAKDPKNFNLINEKHLVLFLVEFWKKNITPNISLNSGKMENIDLSNVIPIPIDWEIRTPNNKKSPFDAMFQMVHSLKSRSPLPQHIITDSGFSLHKYCRQDDMDGLCFTYTSAIKANKLSIYQTIREYGTETLVGGQSLLYNNPKRKQLVEIMKNGELYHLTISSNWKTSGVIDNKVLEPPKRISYESAVSLLMFPRNDLITLYGSHPPSVSNAEIIKIHTGVLFFIFWVFKNYNNVKIMVIVHKLFLFLSIKLLNYYNTFKLIDLYIPNIKNSVSVSFNLFPSLSFV
ncbi:hypothetical protein ACTFIZ_002358 [Dictyostelium cf. discoideum]